MCGTGSSILLGFVNAREVGVSSRNLVSRTFPQIFQSMLTPMQSVGRYIEGYASTLNNLYKKFGPVIFAIIFLEQCSGCLILKHL